MLFIGEGSGIDCDIGNVKKDTEEIETNKAKSLIEVKSTYFVEEDENKEIKPVNIENMKVSKVIDTNTIKGCRKRRISNTILNPLKPNSSSQSDDSEEDNAEGMEEGDGHDNKDSCKRQKIRSKVVNTDLRRKFESNRKYNGSSSDEEKESNEKCVPSADENHENNKKEGA